MSVASQEFKRRIIFLVFLAFFTVFAMSEAVSAFGFVGFYVTAGLVLFTMFVGARFLKAYGKEISESSGWGVDLLRFFFVTLATLGVVFLLFLIAIFAFANA
ncbi:hypothetical protein [Idiomarina loihiensis]|uniref:hypothetical protein n=1 Tax=Idiomarina loihiensis TaxID=135577 RepID=UPI00384FB5E9